MRAAIVIALAALVLLAGCTMVYRSQNVDLHNDRNVSGTNRVFDLTVPNF